MLTCPVSIEYLQVLSFCKLCNQWWKRDTFKGNISSSKSEILFRVVCGHKIKVSYDLVESCDLQFYFLTSFLFQCYWKATRKDTTGLAPDSCGILRLKFTLEQDSAEKQILKTVVHPSEKKYILFGWKLWRLLSSTVCRLRFFLQGLLKHLYGSWQKNVILQDF